MDSWQVCRRWREAAIARPSLWSGISFCPESFSGLSAQVQLERLETQLARAGISPLMIITSTGALESIDPSAPHFRALLAKIHNSRVLRVVNGRLPPGWTLPDSCDPETPLPVYRHLEVLEIRYGNSWVQWLPLHDTPLLTDPRVMDTSLVSFPKWKWANLRTISLEVCQSEIFDLVEAIRLAGRSLHHLTIRRHNSWGRVFAEPGDLPQTLPIVDLVALTEHTLDFENTRPEEMGYVIAHLHTPRLLCLRIAKPDGKNALSILALARSSRFGACVQTFVVDTPRFTREVHVEFMTELEALQTLKFSVHPNYYIPIDRTNALLQALRWPYAADTLHIQPSNPSHNGHKSISGYAPV